MPSTISKAKCNHRCPGACTDCAGTVSGVCISTTSSPAWIAPLPPCPLHWYAHPYTRCVSLGAALRHRARAQAAHLCRDGHPLPRAMWAAETPRGPCRDGAYTNRWNTDTPQQCSTQQHTAQHYISRTHRDPWMIAWTQGRDTRRLPQERIYRIHMDPCHTV